MLRALLIGGVLAILVLSTAGVGRAQAVSGASPSRGTAALNENTSLGASPTPTPEKPLTGGGGSAPNSTAFDQWVAQTANSLSQAGVPPGDIRLPYVGRPAEVVNGVVVPGDTLPPGNWSSFYTRPPAPSGIAYYGENDTTGRTEATTLNASSVVGTLTVNQLNTLYLDDDTPDMWGIQLNAVLSNVTLQGVPGNQFWVQNAATYAPHDGTLNFGEDTWNTSSSTAFGIPSDNSTILRHNPNGSAIGGIYTGFGPYVYAPTPFTLTLYLNTSLTPDGEQELWFNYSVLAASGIRAHGNYDWIVFHSTSPQHPAGVGLPSFEASGTHLSPGGALYDYELDFGIGPEDGSNMAVLAANVSATLDYCPTTIASCTSDQYQSVPAAEDFGGDTGETSTGLSMSYVGTTEFASAGPFILRGLWGFPAAAGSASGFTPVTNAISVSGSPDPTSATPYVFVFFNGSSIINPGFEWAPDEPVWYLPPGTYRYEVMLADYAEQTGTLVVGTTPTRLAVTLPYDSSSGVYTPLWAFSNSQLAGISTSGDGSRSNQYHLFNNPTAGCTACGNAKDGDLSPAFAWWNDFGFPTFAGILIDGTNAYVDLDHPVSFCVFGFTYGPAARPLPGPYFYLQIELVSAHHITLANDPFVGGWPAMYELETLAGLLDAAENPFPTANVVLWNSSDNLVMSNTFVPA
ncbi:MAG: thermopsin family protease, partial [Thermoplasmata archaeon]